MHYLKRLIDLLLSLIIFILIIPVLLLISLSIYLSDYGPILYQQERIGKNGKPFTIYKFRTMDVDAESKEKGYVIVKHDPRITRIGKLLRHSSLDELPQLINVIKGEMSLVGPRPTLGYQVERYNKRQLNRLTVKPGITGWAQVNGRSSLSWPERIEYDLWYINNWSICLDILILLKSIAVICNRNNLYRVCEYDPISNYVPDPSNEENDEK